MKLRAQARVLQEAKQQSPDARCTQADSTYTRVRRKAAVQAGRKLPVSVAMADRPRSEAADPLAEGRDRIAFVSKGRSAKCRAAR